MRLNGKRFLIFLFFVFVLPWCFYPFIKAGTIAKIFEQYVLILPLVGVVVGKSYQTKKADTFSKIVVAFGGLHTLFMLLTIMEVLPSSMVLYLNYGLIGFSSICLLWYCFAFGSRSFYPFKGGWQFLIIAWLFIEAKALYLGTFGKEFHFGLFYLKSFIIVPEYIFLSGLCFFSQEYAWRKIFQEKFQDVFGKRWGVVLLGVIWSLSQLPIWIPSFISNQQNITLSFLMLTRFLNGIGLAAFLGWVYRKTKNIWLCTLLHGMNAMIGQEIVGEFIVLKGIPIGELLWACLLLLFLLSNLYGETIMKRSKQTILQQGNYRKIQ